MTEIVAGPLTAEAFAPFGDVLACDGDPDTIINQGKCGRWHDRARLDFGDGRAGISLFRAQKRTLPYTLDLMERHPLSSQAFVPMTQTSFLVCVASDEGGKPGGIHAFLTAPGQAINLHRNVWHGVLTPLTDPGLFAVIDRIGTEPNLEEHWVAEPVTVIAGRG